MAIPREEDIVSGSEDELTAAERREIERAMIEKIDANILPDLTDDECALLAIMTDPSGLDQAEFLWYEPNNEDGCFRAWPYQWKWWRTGDTFQIDQCARSVGKSLSIAVRAFAFPFLFPGQEMVITAPELVHLEPIVGLIEGRFQGSRVGREMLPKGRSAVTHRPFQMNFKNRSRIIGRIPQRDGKGVKGIHPIWLELDEAQDYPKQGWTELTETLKRGFEGAMWRAHGVTRGARDEFFKRSQDNVKNEWRIHRYPAMFRPNWTDQERQEKIKEYEGREDPDYRRNVLGEHGDATAPMFVLRRLMVCVDTQETSVYNTDEYCLIKIKDEFLASGEAVENLIDFPMSHKQYMGDSVSGKPKCQFWVGMDVGFTVDPSEILVFVEYHPKPNDPSAETSLKLLTRIQMQRMGPSDQVAVMLKVIEFYQPKAFGMDANGVGLPLYRLTQDILKDKPGYDKVMETIKPYNFSEKLIVDFDPTVEPDPFFDDPTERAIRRNTKEYSSDRLRVLVDSHRIEFPYDMDLLSQFQGATMKPAPSGSQDQYGRRIFSKGNDHILDAARFAALSQAQHAIDQIMAGTDQQPVLVQFWD